MEKLLTIQETLRIEPKLNDLVIFVTKLNKVNSTKPIIWAEIWIHNIKPILLNLVGAYCKNPELINYKYFDMWHDYLLRLIPSAK